MEPGQMRAADADRERVAERLRIALDEGRLNLHEYDDRLREAYAARTYDELDRLLVDLPGALPAAGSQLAPVTAAAPAYPRPQSLSWSAGPDGRYPDATRRWLAETWGSWVMAVAICTGIWVVTWIFSDDPGAPYFWPGWVAGPWGGVLLLATIGGLLRDEPQRWAAKQARKQAEREVRRQARTDRPESSEIDG